MLSELEDENTPFYTIKSFSVIVCIAVALAWIFDHLYATDTVYYNSLAEQFSVEKIDELLELRSKWSILVYCFIPLFYLIKFTLVAGCIWIGLTMVDSTISFKKIFTVAIQSEAVFLSATLLKIFWLGFGNESDYDLNDIQIFYPFSLLNFFDTEKIDPLLIYPLQLVNPFEVIYCIVISFKIKQIIKKISFTKSLKLISLSYGLGVMFWIIFLSFILISI